MTIMTNQFEVRQATIEDLDGLTEIFNEYRVFYGQVPNLEEARLFLFERFEHLESIVFIAKDQHTDRVVGFTQLYPVFSSLSMLRSLILNDLYVNEQYRKQGIASLLLDGAQRYAKSIKAKGLELSTAATNDQAQRLYERHGYVKDEEFYHYYLSIKSN